MAPTQMRGAGKGESPRSATPKKAKGPFEILKKMVRQSDIVIQTIDSRYPFVSRTVQKICDDERKPLVAILTKDDLVSVPARVEGVPFARYSSKKPGRYKKQIFSLIYSIASRLGKDDLMKVSVVGYPNTGKSSLINSLSHRKSLSISPEAGHTKAVQWIRFGRILLSDTPGVIPERVEREKLVLMGNLNIEKEKDPLGICESLMRKIFSSEAGKRAFFSHFKIAPCGEGESIEAVAKRRGRVLKGGEPNLSEAARIIVLEWQRGLLRL
ncbi:MAG: GTPase [archaeon]